MECESKSTAGIEDTHMLYIASVLMPFPLDGWIESFQNSGNFVLQKREWTRYYHNLISEELTGNNIIAQSHAILSASKRLLHGHLVIPRVKFTIERLSQL